jgi:hypothetical protein
MSSAGKNGRPEHGQSPDNFANSRRQGKNGKSAFPSTMVFDPEARGYSTCRKTAIILLAAALALV